jgi:hypothetical protein
MRLTNERPFADPEAAAMHIKRIVRDVDAIQGVIHIEKINGPFLFRDKGTPAEYGAGLSARSLAEAARKRNLRDVHAGRCGSIRLT